MIYPFSSTQSAVHFFYAFPIIVFAICLLIDFYNIFQRKIVNEKLETILTLSVGAVIFSIELTSLIGCRSSSCHDRNTMHVLFGLMLLQVGVLYLFFQTEMMKKSFNYLRGLVFSLIGIFMYLHKQSSDFESLIHQAFGIAMIIAGIAANTALIYPSFTPCAVTLVVIAQTLFMFGPDSVNDYFEEKMIMPHNALFMAVCLGLSIICVVHFIIWYYARVNQIDFNEQPSELAPAKLS